MKFMKYKWLYFAISLIILLPGMYFLIKYGLRLSIDFTGGTLLEVANLNSQVSSIMEIAKKQNLELSSIQSADDKTYILRFKNLDKDQNEKFKAELGKDIIESRYESVGPTIGAELTKKAILAVIIASLAIVIFVAWSFKDWKFGASTIFALVHDVLIVLGVFSIFGHFWHVEVDALFVTAILTVIGFSVHDTIVVFDRVRENLPKMTGKSFEEVVDFSISETLVRSINTSLTVTLTLTSLLLFGGESIRWFVAALLIGIISGTYSSIFNAAPLLVLLERGKKA